MKRRKLKDFTYEKPPSAPFDILTELKHFSIVTYAIDPARLVGIVPERFRPHEIDVNGKGRALLSVISFVHDEFRPTIFPFLRLRMAQMNYRVYVRDTELKQDVVWFLGTVLDFWATKAARFLWKLPWHRGVINGEWQVDDETGLYNRYGLTVDAGPMAASFKAVQREARVSSLPGFPDLETGLVILTTPNTGYFRRIDGKIGGYRIWHEPMTVGSGQIIDATFPFLDRLQLVPEADQPTPHSVIMTRRVQFIGHMPPFILRE